MDLTPFALRLMTVLLIVEAGLFFWFKITPLGVFYGLTALTSAYTAYTSRD